MYGDGDDVLNRRRESPTIRGDEDDRRDEYWPVFHGSGAEGYSFDRNDALSLACNFADDAHAYATQVIDKFRLVAAANAATDVAVDLLCP